MDTARIGELLAPFLQSDPPSANPGELTQNQLAQISTYIDLLIRWNSRINLTAIRTPEAIVTRHFGESLFAARHLLFSSANRSAGPAAIDATGVPLVGPAHSSAPSPATEYLVDFGSGAGFPGLPMKIFSPCTRVTLIESNKKKVTFLREAIRALTLTNIDVFPGRADDFAPASATRLTLRAVERFDAAIATAIPLVAPGGVLALLIGQSQVEHAQALAPTLRWSPPLAVPQSETRVLLCGAKAPK
jgi:16S rRNA (guanine527-N7)-methyltransferase